MDHLDAEQLAQLREQLEHERDRLCERQASEDDDAKPEGEIGDMQDKASEEARRNTALRRRAHHEGRLKQVEAALARMDDGSYGLCEETDESIPFARLRAEPTTRYTVEALELLEEERGREGVAQHAPDETDAY